MSNEKIKITCVVCGVEHERITWHTWHQNQCDDCITRWADEKARTELDAALLPCYSDEDLKPRRHVLAEHARILKVWDTARKLRGL